MSKVTWLCCDSKCPTVASQCGVGMYHLSVRTPRVVCFQSSELNWLQRILHEEEKET